MRDVLYCNKKRRKAGLALVYHRIGLLQGFQLYCGRLPCPLLLRRQAVPEVEYTPAVLLTADDFEEDE